MRANRLAALAVPLILLTAGCGSAGPSGSSSAPDPGGVATAATTGPAGAPGCPASSVVATNLGMTIGDPPDVTTGDDAVVCDYTGKLVADGRSAVVTLRLGGHSDASDVARFRQEEKDQGYTVVDQPGVGDEAFTFTTNGFNTTINNLVTRHGDYLIYLGSRATVEQEVAFAELLFSQR